MLESIVYLVRLLLAVIRWSVVWWRGIMQQGQANGGPMVPPGVPLAYDNALKKLEQQRRDIDQLDTKIAAIIALLGVVVAAYVVDARTGLERIGGGVLLFLAILSALYAYFIRHYADAPAPRTFAGYAGYTSEGMKELFLSAVLEAYESNARQFRWKVRASNTALVLLGGFGTLVIIVVTCALDSRV